jgi:DNA mismatch endonuclease (patch repair protein)
MRANRRRDTAPELALRREVHKRGLRYYVDTRPIPELRRTADLLFPRAKVAVFVDGCFWHGCPAHHTHARTNAAYWADKLAKNRARDQNTNERLRAAGWVVLRFWEHVPVSEAADQVQSVVSARRFARDA